MQKNRGQILLAIYLFLAIYLLPIFTRDNSPNELTRWATAAAIIEKSSFEIGWTRDLIGNNVEAISRDSAEMYSDKAPGTAVLAAPFYALTRLFVGAPTTENIRISWFVMRFFIATLPLFVLALWLYKRDVDEYSLAALLFATPLFLYSLLFFSHVLVGVCLYFVFRLLYDTDRIFLRNCLAAGLLAGIAVSCEYGAVIPVFVFGAGLYFADKRERGLRLICFFAGISPFAIFLLIYNFWLFGSPFFPLENSFAVSTAADASVFGYPTPDKIYQWLFSPARGVFFYSPLLIFSVFAFFTSRERRTLRHRVKIFSVALSVLILCGYDFRNDDWTMGARHLILIVPLLLDSFFDGEIEYYPSFWRAFLLGASIILCAVPVLTFPFAPSKFLFPHKDLWAKLIISEAWFMPNLAGVFGFSASFWTILPVLILFVAILYTVWRSAKFPARFFAGIFCAALLITAYLVIPPTENAKNNFQRFIESTDHREK